MGQLSGILGELSFFVCLPIIRKPLIYKDLYSRVRLLFDIVAYFFL